MQNSSKWAHKFGDPCPCKTFGDPCLIRFPPKWGWEAFAGGGAWGWAPSSHASCGRAPRARPPGTLVSSRAPASSPRLASPGSRKGRERERVSRLPPKGLLGRWAERNPWIPSEVGALNVAPPVLPPSPRPPLGSWPLLSMGVWSICTQRLSREVK